MGVVHDRILTPDEVSQWRRRRAIGFRNTVVKRTTLDPLTGCWIIRGRVETHGINPRCGTVFRLYLGFPRRDGTIDPGLLTVNHCCVAMAILLDLDPKEVPAHWWKGLRPNCGNPRCWNPNHMTFTPETAGKLRRALEDYSWKIYSLNTYVDVGEEAYLDAIEQTGSSERIAASWTSDTREE